MLKPENVMTIKIYETNNVHYGTPPYQKERKHGMKIVNIERLGSSTVFLPVFVLHVAQLLLAVGVVIFAAALPVAFTGGLL